MSQQPIAAAGPEYWSTLSQYHQDAEFLERAGEEFYPAAKPERFFEAGENTLLSPMQRRTFMKLSGFAALAAAITGCERPVDHVLPYVNKPDEAAFNNALYYASTCTECAAACGLLVKTKVGRPIKLEGNPDHPMNRGALCTRGQAGIYNLYDPDRLRHPVASGRKGNKALNAEKRLAAYDAEVGARLGAAKGKIVLVTPTLNGPSNARLLTEFKRSGANYEHVEYDPLGPSVELAAYQAAFGTAAYPRYSWAKADVILCLGGDPIGQSVSKVETQMDIASRRKPSRDGMSRLYVFEPVPTLTGMAADYRYNVHPGHLLEIGFAIANQLVTAHADAIGSVDGSVRQLLGAYQPADVAKKAGIAVKEIERVAASLANAKGRAIVNATGAAATTAQALALQNLTIFLNNLLGSYASTIDVAATPSNQFRGGTNALLSLVGRMNSGEIDVVIFSGVNPVYTLPAGAGFAEALAKVPYVVSLNLRMDETTALADVAIPAVHGLESWGDAEPQAGLFSIQQPVINVLFGPDAAAGTYETRAWQESIIAFLTAAGRATFEQEVKAEDGTVSKSTQTWYDFVRQTWERQVFPGAAASRTDFDKQWLALLQSGVLDTAAAKRTAATIAGAPAASVLAGLAAAGTAASGKVLVAYPSNVHGDGASMSNPVLLELPDAVSKISWDNHLSISPGHAEALGVKDGTVLELELASGKMKAPVFIQPGMRDDVVAIQLGWGRNTFDAIGDGIGVNAWPAVQVAAGALTLSGLEIKSISKTSESIRLANTQGHNYLFSPKLVLAPNKRKGEVPEGATVNTAGEPVYERPIVGETTWNEWKANPYAGYPNHVDPEGTQVPPTMWERSHKYQGHHWGMSIDLNACNGCGACIVACNVENNVPVVGKDEVIKGREMFWLRIDRYYRGTPENPDFVQQAVLCQHCDNAPCETVCPVIATMHNDEGLNVMTYNRCVGTRYCANNCPYKVRRFNFWQYTDYRTGPYDNVKRVSPLELVLNPEVSTRTRGVMEKCTFCNHRIRVAKDKARQSGEPLKDGAMLTACQQTCPAKAIHFGDRNDEFSQISKDWIDPRAYGLLADLNTDPSIRYMTLVRNRDEKSPYRTKYSSHREDHQAAGHDDHSGHDHDHDHDHSHDNGAHH